MGAQVLAAGGTDSRERADGMEIEVVRRLADGLDEREHTVLWRHYGLGQPPQTLTRIGSDLGLSAERIRQIEKQALEKLREAVAQPSAAI